MNLKHMSFDAVITDINGLTFEVDCRVSEPAAGGLAGEILIEIPLPNKDILDLANPCSLRSVNSGLDIEIKDLWYRSISSDLQSRKHARGVVNITYAGQIWVKKAISTSGQGCLRFILSPIRFLKMHRKASMADYSTTPDKTVEIFRLKAAELGEIRFIKFWSFHRVDANGVAAEIRTSYAAEIQYDGTSKIDLLVEKIRQVLTPLSILSRQAITLHGWYWEKPDGIESMWYSPLEPNLAPDMAEEPDIDLCFPEEFETHAQAIVGKFLQLSPKSRGTITLLSIALAPHIKRSTAGNFTALFGVIEEVIDSVELLRGEKEMLRETDRPLIEALLAKSRQIKGTNHPHASAVAARLEGYAEHVSNSGPSFNVRFDRFIAAYPQLPGYLTDLWPLQGKDKKPGLKQLRNSLAHGLSRKYNPQAVAVAHWHIARLAERIVFIILGIDMPKGISPNSFLLRREPWYVHANWETVQSQAKLSS